MTTIEKLKARWRDVTPEDDDRPGRHYRLVLHEDDGRDDKSIFILDLRLLVSLVSEKSHWRATTIGGLDWRIDIKAARPEEAQKQALTQLNMRLMQLSQWAAQAARDLGE